jgi:hypothetical protein
MDLGMKLDVAFEGSYSSTEDMWENKWVEYRATRNKIEPEPSSASRFIGDVRSALNRMYKKYDETTNQYIFDPYLERLCICFRKAEIAYGRISSHPFRDFISDYLNAINDECVQRKFVDAGMLFSLDDTESLVRLAKHLGCFKALEKFEAKIVDLSKPVVAKQQNSTTSDESDKGSVLTDTKEPRKSKREKIPHKVCIAVFYHMLRSLYDAECKDHMQMPDKDVLAHFMSSLHDNEESIQSILSTVWVKGERLKILSAKDYEHAQNILTRLGLNASDKFLTQ